MQGNGGNNGADQSGTKGNNGNSARPNSKPDDTNRQIGGNQPDNDGNSESSETNRQVKPSGLSVIGLPPKVKGSNTPIDITRQKLDDVLTKKESQELKPRLIAFFKVVFDGMDKGITASNKMKAQANIWSNLSDDELDVIATYFVEGGQKSKVMATISRGIGRNYSQYQLGVITIPRMIATALHYKQYGGFDNPLKSLFGGVN